MFYLTYLLRKIIYSWYILMSVKYQINIQKKMLNKYKFITFRTKMLIFILLYIFSIQYQKE